MDTITLIHQGVLFAHLAAFAIAFSAVLREDLSFLKARRIDVQRLAATARTLTGTLAVLWLTGLALMAFDLGPDLSAISIGPKLTAKLMVVTALTANGIALHALAFPLLRGTRAAQPFDATVSVVLGAISSASWLGASFIGASRLIAPAMGFADFVAAYAALLGVAVTAALVFVRPRFARLLLAAR